MNDRVACDISHREDPQHGAEGTADMAAIVALGDNVASHQESAAEYMRDLHSLVLQVEADSKLQADAFKEELARATTRKAIPRLHEVVSDLGRTHLEA